MVEDDDSSDLGSAFVLGIQQLGHVHHVHVASCRDIQEAVQNSVEQVLGKGAHQIKIWHRLPQSMVSQLMTAYGEMECVDTRETVWREVVNSVRVSIKEVLECEDFEVTNREEAGHRNTEKKRPQLALVFLAKKLPCDDPEKTRVDLTLTIVHGTSYAAYCERKIEQGYLVPHRIVSEDRNALNELRSRFGSSRIGQNYGDIRQNIRNDANAHFERITNVDGEKKGNAEGESAQS